MKFEKRLDFAVNVQCLLAFFLFIMMIVNFLIQFVNYIRLPKAEMKVLVSDKCEVISSLVHHFNWTIHFISFQVFHFICIWILKYPNSNTNKYKCVLCVLGISRFSTILHHLEWMLENKFYFFPSVRLCFIRSSTAHVFFFLLTFSLVI